MNEYILKNLTLIDCTGTAPQEDAAVIISDNTIKEILPKEREIRGSGLQSIDCRGQYLLPGLIDGHVHICSTEGDIVEQQRRNYPSYGILKSIAFINDTLAQGFTTARDCGGADAGLRQAVAENLIQGPRLIVCNTILSQTGGHGDFRLPAETHTPVIGIGGVSSGIFDGVDAVRRGAREQLRQGADFIKIMAGGGVASPADEITSSQYSPEEIRTAVFEAESAGTYVAAHAYADRSIVMCAEAGVHTIEHGNLITEIGAAAMKKAGTCLMPNVISYDMMYRLAKEHQLPEFNIRKNILALEKAYSGLEIARSMGVKTGYGTDLLGPLQSYKGAGLELHAKVLGAMETLMSATRINAEIIGVDDKVGTIEPGKLADLILVNKNPLEDMGVFKNYRDNITMIIKDGQLFKNIL